MNVASLISATAEVASQVDPPADPDEALALVAAAVEADQELMAMCSRIADHHAEVREQWKAFDPAGMPPPGEKPGGCGSSLVSPLFWLRVIRSLVTGVFPRTSGGGEAGGSSLTPAELSAPGNHDLRTGE